MATPPSNASMSVGIVNGLLQEISETDDQTVRDRNWNTICSYQNHPDLTSTAAAQIEELVKSFRSKQRKPCKADNQEVRAAGADIKGEREADTEARIDWGEIERCVCIKFASKHRGIEDEPVRLYMLNYDKDNKEQRVPEAARTIVRFLGANEGVLGRTFPLISGMVDPVFLAGNPYLIVNGRAVSLCATRPASVEVNPDLIDMHFTLGLLCEPTKCASGKHVLELKLAEIWKEVMGDFCPAEYGVRDARHQLGDLTLDKILSYKADRERVLIGEKRSKLEEEKTQLEEVVANSFALVGRNQELSDINDQLKARNVMTERRLVGFKRGPCIPGVYGFATIAKISGKVVVVAGPKVVNSLGKQLAKIVPFVGIGVGMALATHRWSKGGAWNRLLSLIEAGSGIASVIPGVGTIVSLSLDGVLIMADIGHAIYMRTQNKEGGAPDRISLENANKTQGGAPDRIALEKAYKILGLDPVKNPSRDEVETKFREVSTKCHPDANIQGGELVAQEFGRLFVQATEAKELIFQVRGFEDGTHAGPPGED